MTTYKTPFGDMAHGDKIGVPLSEWEEKTGVKAANGAEYALNKQGAVLRLFNVNDPPLLVVEQVGVECIELDRHILVSVSASDETETEYEPESDYDHGDALFDAGLH